METDLLLHVKVTQVSRVDSKSSIYGMVFGWPLKGCLQVVSVQFRKWGVIGEFANMLLSS